MNHKDWLSEPVLYTIWRHRGSLEAMTGAELIAIDPKQFMTVMSVHPKPWHFAVSYAKAFVKFLNALGEDLTDILQCTGMYEQIMEGMTMLPSESDATVMKEAPPSESQVHPTRSTCKSVSPSHGHNDVAANRLG